MRTRDSAVTNSDAVRRLAAEICGPILTPVSLWWLLEGNTDPVPDGSKRRRGAPAGLPANGEAIRKYRQELGLTQPALAGNSGLSNSTIERSERGANIEKSNLKHLADTFSKLRGEPITLEMLTRK